jgi:hypothetical protein
MNIFVLDYNTELCAEYHCDKHVVKMILETVQMICTNHHIYNLHTLDWEDIPYKPTHQMHPCTVWARASKQNYLWLCDLLEALHNEWQYRFDTKHNLDHEREHKSYTVFKQLNHEAMADLLPDIGLQPFAQAMPEEYQIFDIDAVSAYRLYYAKDKAGLLNYTKRSKPEWLKDY